MNYFSCSKCGKAIAPHKSNLSRHESQCKGIVDKRRIACPECKQVFSRNELLRNHVEVHHHVNLEKEELFFLIYSDFLKWKEKIEKENLCFYAVRTRTNSVSSKASKYLYCHRSGHFISESLGFRKIKSQESNKIDSTCTSTMVVTEVHGGARVIFYKTHFGHGSNEGRCYSTRSKRTTPNKSAENFEALERAAVVKTIPNKSAENCESLERAAIVKAVPNKSAENCESLERAAVVKIMPNKSAENCESLERAAIVKAIPNKSAENCESLERAAVVKTIPNKSAENCELLEKAAVVKTIPNKSAENFESLERAAIESAENFEALERAAIVKDDSGKIAEEERNFIIQKLNNAIRLMSVNNCSQEDYIIIHKKLDSLLNVLRGSRKRKMRNVTNLESPNKAIEKQLKF